MDDIVWSGNTQVASFPLPTKDQIPAPAFKHKQGKTAWIYVWSYPSHKAAAKGRRDRPYLCKVGYTNRDPRVRVVECLPKQLAGQVAGCVFCPGRDKNRRAPVYPPRCQKGAPHAISTGAPVRFFLWPAVVPACGRLRWSQCHKAPRCRPSFCETKSCATGCRASPAYSLWHGRCCFGVGC